MKSITAVLGRTDHWHSPRAVALAALWVALLAGCGERAKPQAPTPAKSEPVKAAPEKAAESAPERAAEKQAPEPKAAEPQKLDGAVCGVDKASDKIRVVRWDKDKGAWDKQSKRLFQLSPSTVIKGESEATVGDLDSGKATVKSMHLTGLGASGLTGSPFVINSITKLLHRRVTVEWSGSEEVPVVTKLSLPYLFGGESMPAYTNGTSSSVAGSDDVNIGN
jgi:hypothetical protein